MLAKAGEDVTLIARGAHLRAMQEHGVRVRGALGSFDARVSATDDPATVGAVDVVLLTLKTHSLTTMAPRLAPLIGAETSVVSMQNGIPWWYSTVTAASGTERNLNRSIPAERLPKTSIRRE